MSLPEIVIGLICLAAALLIHEFAHAWMAYQLGDPTAKYDGRLTLNPLVHFEPLGALTLVVSYISTGGHLIMGWAKPVPVNGDNFKNRSLDLGLVAVAGPFVNFFTAFLCSLVILTGLASNPAVFVVFKRLIVANVGFGLFNLIPWPPLDGWKMLAAVMPDSVSAKMRDLEIKAGIYSLIGLLIIMAIVGKALLTPLNATLINFFTGGR